METPQGLVVGQNYRDDVLGFFVSKLNTKNSLVYFHLNCDLSFLAIKWTIFINRF